MKYDDLISIHDKYFAQRAQLVHEKKKLKRTLKRAKKELRDNTNTREVLNEAIQTIHAKFKDKIEATVTSACNQIFGRNLELELQYQEKSNRIESKIIIKEDGTELSPKDDLGGSIIDIISFMFRIVLWHMSSPRTRNVFIFDEPFKFCGKFTPLAAAIVKELSSVLNFQVIMITHDDNLIEVADKVFKVEHSRGVSRVKQIRKSKV